jgi:hypothetical protein
MEGRHYFAWQFGLAVWAATCTQVERRSSFHNVLPPATSTAGAQGHDVFFEVEGINFSQEILAQGDQISQGYGTFCVNEVFIKIVR